MAALLLILAAAASLGVRPAAAAVYNEEMTLDKRSDGCSCTCSYLGGMCRTGATDAPCCQDVCCGAGADFPSIVAGRDASAPPWADSGVAPIRGMLLPEAGAADMDIGSASSASSDEPVLGPELYNHPLTMTRRRSGCECECSYVGGMCRTGTSLDCCQEVCCGADVGFPSTHADDVAPSRGMLSGPLAGPLAGPIPGLKTEDSTETMEEGYEPPPEVAEETPTILPAAAPREAAHAEDCFEREAAWTPDMAPASQEPDAQTCQQRCAKMDGCARFTFFQATGACQVHDTFSVRSQGLAGFVSGPFMCWDQLNRNEYTKVDDQTFLPRVFGCMQPGVTWLPAMGAIRQLAGSRLEVSRACRKLCEDTKACEHYTVTLPSSCHLSDISAQKATEVKFSLSGGPGGCDAAAEVVMKSTAGLRAGSAGDSRSHTIVALSMGFAAGVAFLVTLSLVIRHQRLSKSIRRDLLVRNRRDSHGTWENLAQ